PTRLVVPFELEPGATSDPIELPVDVPVSLIAASLTPGDVGVANASLLPSTGVADPGDEYVSRVSTKAGNMPAISGGPSDTPGQPVVMIDEGGTVEVQPAGTTAIQIANLSAAAATGTLTLTW